MTGNEPMVLVANERLAVVIQPGLGSDALYLFGDGAVQRLAAKENFQAASELRGPFEEAA